MPERPIPDDWRQRSPLLDDEGFALLDRIQQHADAPRWNVGFNIGDRLLRSDLAALDGFRLELAEGEGGASTATPPARILDWVRAMRERVLLFREHLPEGFDLSRDWAHVPTMSREDLALRINLIVPFDEALERLIVYDTSGTTGHAIRVPTHPLAVAKAQVLVEGVLREHGALPEFGPGQVACMNVCAQARTYVFPSVFTMWNQAGFAKVNLNEADWASGIEGARRFFAELSPQFLTGNPVAFAELLRHEIPVAPRAIVSTAVALTPGLRQRLADHYRCPVIDWYGSSETGPIACTAPGREGYRVMCDDLFVECTDPDGYPVEPGERGEITVTGGRNPYVPLLRYRTGDWARLEREGGETWLHDLQGRAPVFFRASDGSIVNPVDIGRMLRLHAVFVQHVFRQKADGSCELRLRPAPGAPLDPGLLTARLRELFGADHPIDVVLDEELGSQGKVIPYQTELVLGGDP